MTGVSANWNLYFLGFVYIDYKETVDRNFFDIVRDCPVR